MRKTNTIIIALLIFIVSANNSYAQRERAIEQTFKFGRVLEVIEREYVDSVNTEELVEDAIIDLLAKLDPHSVYISKEEVQRMNEPLQGNFEGIGVYFNILNDTILVVSPPIAGGPAEKTGVRAGDRIVLIDGEKVAGIGIDNKGVQDRLKGPKGTKVNVGIVRRERTQVIDFTITRDKIPIYSVDANYIIDNNTGYIKISRFAFTTFKEFMDAVNELQEQGAKNLIIDLTGNGGGYMDIAIKMADQFLSDGKLIVYTNGRNAPRRDYLATESGTFDNKGKVVVLIDEGAASASEIVAGAIQDWDRGLIVGRRSFGKGLVQNPVLLPDRSMLRLTVARYYTPTGRLIQKSYDDGTENYHNDILNRYNHGEFVNKDSIQFPDSLKYYTINNKRLVYGGGGIMPDVFVPIDTTEYSNYFNALIRKGILNSFVLDYLDENRKALNIKYENFSAFNADFNVDQSMLKQLTDYASSERLLYKEDEFSTSQQRIKLLLKAYFARDLYSTNAFYQVINEHEPIIKKALEVINDDKRYSNLLK